MKLRLSLLTSILLALIVLPVKAQGELPAIPAPPPSGSYIVDELDWLQPEQEATINSIVQSLDRDGVAEIAVVTLDDCGPDKQSFRKSLFDEWGIGHADDNDGLLILVCWYGGDPARRSVEQLYGRGLNGILTSSRTDQFAQEDFVPDFQSGKPGDGLVGMVRHYDIFLRVETADRSVFTTLGRRFKALDDEMQGGLMFLVVLAVFVLIERLLPRSWRERLYSERDRSIDSDRDSFGGGRSSGGGGSSTRF